MSPIRLIFLFGVTVGLFELIMLQKSLAAESVADDSKLQLQSPAPGTVRVATFNVALNRKSAGQLVADLKAGDVQAKRLATVIQLVAPDVLLVNELDYDGDESAKRFLNEFLRKPQGIIDGLKPSQLEHVYTGPVNTGVDSGLDLNLNNRLHDSDDGWGYGAFPGQYGMAVYSRYPIDGSSVRSFQKFLWSRMPGALRPKLVDKDTGKEKFFHSDDVWNQLRLSSKSHWDVPIQIEGKTLHVIASHPTPPVFDGPEDRNGCRNHDEIRMLKDYVAGDKSSEYLVDDSGKSGGLESKASFVIMGDLNSDPNDGSGLSIAIEQLLKSPRVLSQPTPKSKGAAAASAKQAGANAKHKGDPAEDTGDFNDNTPGNLRIDFVLPSANCEIVNSGVFWPAPDELSETTEPLADASDHHLVWVDIRLK